MKRRAVVLAGDNSYIVPIETVIKSLCVHHTNLDIFVFNQDIPQEWFLVFKRFVEQTGNCLNDIKLFHEQLTQKWNNTSLPHINCMTYARYFIPEYVNYDRVLYLDCDLIVTDNIDCLFEIDMKDMYVAAARATFGVGIGFNAGVLVINNKLWKQEGIVEQLLEATKNMPEAPEGDQTILNHLFQDKYIELDDTYNFQIGFDLGASVYGHKFIFDIPLNPLPKIIHYISGQKPWHFMTNMRLRDIWWNYRMLQFSEIIAGKKISQLNKSTINQSPIPNTNVLIMTNSDTLEHIEEIVQELPECTFHIAAYTELSNKLIKLQVFENIRLYKAVLEPTINMLISSADIYLDINHGEKFEDILLSVSRKNVPILAFENTCTSSVDEKIFTNGDFISLVQEIRNYQ